MIEIHGIKNCDSVKKALSFFNKHNLHYTFHDFKMHPATCDKISSWLQKSDMQLLLNTRSTTYRTLKLKEKNLSDKEKKEWLCKENLLIKRPVVEFNEKIIIGFKEEIYEGVFL